MHIIYRLGVTVVLLMLTACSPHPGAGKWIVADDGKEADITEFVRIHVSYEGRTNIFGRGNGPEADSDSTAIRRCFWHGIDAQTIELSCVQALNTDIEESYRFRVDAGRNSAELLQDGRVVGRFVRNTAS